MTKITPVVSSLLLVLSVMLWACAPAATPITAPPPTPRVILSPTVPPATPTPAPTPTKVAPAAVVPTAAPPAPAAQKPRYGGILKPVMREDLAHFDLHQEALFRAVHPLAPVYNLLVKQDPADPSKVVPDLAERWEVSPDGKNYTLFLRKAAKWHDGVPFTSADVKASYERLASPPKGMASPRMAYYKAIEKVETPDTNTVKFYLKYPQSSFLTMLTVAFSVVYPKHLLDAKGDMKKDIVGTGPFKLKEYVRGVSLEVVKNPDYFIKDRPYLDGILRYKIDDNAAQEAALRTGQVDLLQTNEHRFGPPERQKLQADMPGLVADVKLGPTAWGFNFGFKKTKLWGDVRVRRAVWLAIDREEMIKVLTRGDAALGGFMMPGPWAIPEAELLKMPGYRKPKDQDIAEAKRLLAEAGYPQGFETILVTRTPGYENAAVAGKDQLAKIGIGSKLELAESGAFLARYIAADFESMSYGFIAVELGDPDVIYSRFVTDSGNNYGRYSSQKYDELYAKQSQTMDPAARKALVLEIQRLLIDDPPGVPYYWANVSAVYWSKLRDYSWINLYQGHDLQDAWLAQ